MAAVDLHGIDRAFEAHVGQIGLHHRGDEGGEIIGLLPLVRVRVLRREVDHKTGPQRQRPRALHKGLLLHQHAAHVRVHDDRVGRLVLCLHAGQGTALHAVPGVDHGVLVGGGGLAEALDADTQTGGVHHGEHGAHALVRRAQQPALRPVIVHDAGGIAVDAHLVLDGAALQAVALPRFAILVQQELRHHEQADALDALRPAGDLRQHQVDDVLRHVMFTGGDEDLLPGDQIAAIVLRFGLRAHQAQVGTAMRFRQVHGTGPFAADHLRQVGPLLRVITPVVDRLIGAMGQARIHGEGHVGRRCHLGDGEAQHMRQALPAIFGVCRQTAPAAFDIGPVGFLESGWRGDAAIVVACAAFGVTDGIQRRQLVLEELRALLQDRVHQIGGRVGKAGQVGIALQVDELVQQELEVLYRGLIGRGHSRLSCGFFVACSIPLPVRVPEGHIWPTTH